MILNMHLFETDKQAAHDVSIRADQIIAITAYGEGGAEVYLAGGSQIPVAESYAEVVAGLNQVTQMVAQAMQRQALAQGVPAFVPGSLRAG